MNENCKFYRGKHNTKKNRQKTVHLQTGKKQEFLFNRHIHMLCAVNECQECKTKHTSTWQMTMQTLSDIITISFCLNLHSINTISFKLYL